MKYATIPAIPLLLALPALLPAGGCLSVKTEHEVKPISMTIDINLKVDKEIDKAFSENTHPQPPKRFQDIIALLDRKVVGIDNHGYIAARGDLTDDEKLLVAEENDIRRRRYQEVADKNGVSLETAEKRGAARAREFVPAGKGILYQDENGNWKALD